jgi:uncharacterized protein with HEPN domain
MYDKTLVKDILLQIKEGISRIQKRIEPINSPDDFLSDDDGLTKLDGICMMLIAIGESLKNLDKITNKSLFVKYSSVDWKGAKGVRDVISHHYFDLDAEVIFSICRERIPGMAETLII